MPKILKIHNYDQKFYSSSFIGFIISKCRLIILVTFIIFFSSACDSIQSATPSDVSELSGTQTPQYMDSSQPISARVEDLISRMTLEEKIGQMTQVEKDSIQSGDITKLFIGSILSGGGGSPDENNVEVWVAMTDGFKRKPCQHAWAFRSSMGWMLFTVMEIFLVPRFFHIKYV